MSFPLPQTTDTTQLTFTQLYQLLEVCEELVHPCCNIRSCL